MGGRHRTDELEGGYNPYYEPPRRRASRGKVFVPLAGAVALAVLLGIAAYVVVNKDPACGEQKINLSVVASPDIRPAIQKMATRFEKSGTRVAGKCLAITVKGTKSAAVTQAMSQGGDNAKIDPDIWIPDSSLWLAGLAKNGTVLKSVGSAARSPIVLTASKTGAEKLRAAFSPASWTGLTTAANAANPDGLAKKVRVLALDPAQNAAGLGALLAAAGVLKAQGGGDELLVGVLRQLSESTVPSPDSLFATLTKAAARIPVGVASEQSIWAFNTKTTPSNPVVALYPAEGTVNLDYPIIVTAKDAQARQAAQAFTTAVMSTAGRKTTQDYGFRSPDGAGGSALKAENGVNAKNPTPMPIPDTATVNRLAQAWRQLKMETKLLALVDISGTMALPADSTGVSRMRAIAGVGIEGLKLFPDKTSIGTWVFSDNLEGDGVDWKEVVPIGPLAQQIDGVTRRDLIARSLQQIKAIPTGNTGLNDTLWAAYKTMKENYDPERINTIILFTDGVGNDDPSGGISNSGILRRLREAYDPNTPINILIVSFNTKEDENRAQMTAIAKATDGAAYFPQTVLEIRNIFLKGIARRLCAPKCDSAQSQ